MVLSLSNETTLRIRVETNYFAQHRNQGAYYRPIRINPQSPRGHDIIPEPMFLCLGCVEKAK